MASSDFEILPCELSDMPACVDIFDEAFATDPAVLYLYPHCDPKVLKEKALKGYEKSYTAPGTKYFKAVHKETGEVAAFSKWGYPHTPDANAEDFEAAIRKDPQPPGSNDELVVKYFTEFHRGRKKWMMPESYYFMSLLAVRPKYQRKGLGSMLLSPVLELADKENAKTYIQASAEGLGLYQRHGWIQVDEIVIDFSPYGGSMQVKTALLIREPRNAMGLGYGQTR